MGELRIRWDASSLEAKVASELSALLENVPVGSALTIAPNADFLVMLERYIPQQLSHHYPEWRYESLDGFFFRKAQKVGSETALFFGLCILISDQTVTPILFRLAIDPSNPSKLLHQICLGEPGSGPLSISGPLCTSSHAHTLLVKIEHRLDTIYWSYLTTTDAL